MSVEQRRPRRALMAHRSFPSAIQPFGKYTSVTRASAVTPDPACDLRPACDMRAARDFFSRARLRSSYAARSTQLRAPPAAPHAAPLSLSLPGAWRVARPPRPRCVVTLTACLSHPAARGPVTAQSPRLPRRLACRRRSRSLAQRRRAGARCWRGSRGHGGEGSRQACDGRKMVGAGRGAVHGVARGSP